MIPKQFLPHYGMRHCFTETFSFISDLLSVPAEMNRYYDNTNWDLLSPFPPHFLFTKHIILHLKSSLLHFTPALL